MKWFQTLLIGTEAANFAFLQKRKILIIEDNLCLQTPLEQLIKRLDPEIEVAWATTADEVLKGMEDNHLPLDQIYGLVISDIILPGKLSGIELWSKCRARFPRLAFMFMSGIGIDEYLEAVHKQLVANPPPFLPKPFTTEECTQAIRCLLRAA